MIESVVRENTPVYSRGAGYWITPSNHFFSVTTHIAVICTFPDAFGFDAAELQDLFEQHNEPMGSEGTARFIAIVRAVQQESWIRVRHYRSGWSFNVPSLDPVSLGRVAGFFAAFTVGVPDENLRLDHPAGRLLTSSGDGLKKLAAEYQRLEPAWTPPTLHYVPEHDIPALLSRAESCPL